MSEFARPFTRPPHPFLIEPLVRRALEEDLGRSGDLTTELLVPPTQSAEAQIVARASGALAGLVCADCALRLIDDRVEITVAALDGEAVQAGTSVATIRGPARALLTAERVALNFLAHLSGIATATRALVETVA